MRGDIKDLIDFITKEELPMYNKAELARRYGRDPRTIDRYLKIQSGEIKPKRILVSITLSLMIIKI